MHVCDINKYYLTSFFHLTCMLVGQLHLWNPDEPGTPRGSMVLLGDLEERLNTACQQLSLPLHGKATVHQLRTLCQHLGLEVHTYIQTYLCIRVHLCSWSHVFVCVCVLGRRGCLPVCRWEERECAGVCILHPQQQQTTYSFCLNTLQTAKETSLYTGNLFLTHAQVFTSLNFSITHII